MSWFHPNKLTKAFDSLQCRGYVADDEPIACCLSCGWAYITKFFGSKKDFPNIVFYHDQDRDRLEDTGSMCLAWSGDGKVICEVLNRHGIKTEWNGDDAQRIAITP